MDFYFGVDLLHHLQRHYEQRLSLALSKSFNQADSRYYWLFKELECRVTTLRKLLVMISALPGFMCRQTEEQVFAMVVNSTSSWFSDDVLGEQQKEPGSYGGWRAVAGCFSRADTAGAAAGTVRPTCSAVVAEIHAASAAGCIMGTGDGIAWNGGRNAA